MSRSSVAVPDLDCSTNAISILPDDTLFMFIASESLSELVRVWYRHDQHIKITGSSDRRRFAYSKV